MTYSVVALSGDGSRLGVAAASRSLAVGAAVPALAPGVGAVVTQAYTNQRFRALGLQLLREGLEPAEVIARLARVDEQFDRRQVGVVDAHGRTAAWTGPACTPWAGAFEGEGYVVLGNFLAGPAVVGGMRRAMDDGPADPLPARLLSALEAAQAAGGDSRGQQSAVLRVVSNAAEDVWPPLSEVDLRVDDHPEPLPGLRSMLAALPGPTMS